MKRKIICFAALSILVFASAGLAQSPSPSGEGVRSKTLWQQSQEGGWVMFPIAICSVLTVYLIGDGVLRTGRARLAPPEHEQNVKTLFRQGDYVGAYNYCKEHPSALTNVLRVGIGLLGDGKEVAEEGMTGELAKEIGRASCRGRVEISVVPLLLKKK